MTRLSRFVFALLLLSVVTACSAPTAPVAAKRPTAKSEPLLECIGGWEVTNGTLTPC